MCLGTNEAGEGEASRWELAVSRTMAISLLETDLGSPGWDVVARLWKDSTVEAGVFIIIL